MRIVITHSEMGIFIGSSTGLAFWSRMDSAGQGCAVSFESQEQARKLIRGWRNKAINDPAAYTFAEVSCDRYATLADLIKAGLGDMTGDMLANMADNSPAH